MFGYISGIVKKVCDLDKGVASQCLTADTFRKMGAGRSGTRAVAHNICLKINVKMGGVNSRVYPSSPR